ncbi:mechanosensitive ion channel protein MscL [Leptolyngbya sp. BL0902]|uniref:large conductance mechanosensitive channel protein MscL n=1 Tax=Leptolyngbya sp. BL0902 TaxID=1115757 RepID=UPI0018E732D2|nr:large conductance mechanosensitive channel protein MscL [Leptolyngbya sp. BL0902]QQE66156.1 mechanosensitive ion channel protein MscL [Leptolyngbya sp. BL0902]
MANSTQRAQARARSFWSDFRAFALKGNVVDLAVAVIIGGAFGSIISSFVEDVIMPAVLNPLLAQAGTDWREAVVGPGIRLGSFLGTVIDFVIIALVLFLVVRAFEKMKRKEEVEAAANAEPTTEEKLNETLARLADVLEKRG